MKNVLFSCGCAVLLAALVPAQDAQALLARVRVIEEQEGDLRGAEQEYKKLLDSRDAGAVHAEAALRLGRMLWRLDKKDEGRPFLERAVAAGGKVGEDAQAVLQGQGPDSKQAQEIAQKAQDAILRLVGEKPSTGNAEEDLRWLGAPAVVEITRQLDERRPAAMEALGPLRKAYGDDVTSLRGLLTGNISPPGTQDLMRAVTRVGAVGRLIRLLWSMGGGEAARWLHAVSADADVQWRRVVAFGCDNANESLFPEVELRLGDADPDGVVPLFALANYRGALGPLAALLDVRVPAVRAQAWRCVESRWEWNNSGKWADDAMQLVEPALVRALGDNDPAVARSAFGLLCNKAVVTERGMAVLLEWLPRVPVFTGLGATQAWAPVASAWRAAKALGPANPADGKDPRRHFVAGMACVSLSRAAQPAASAQLLDLVELGYDYNGNLLAGAVTAATEDADLVRAAGLIERDARPAFAVEVLAKRDLPSATLPGLRKRLPIVLERVPVQTREQKAVPMSPDQQQVAREAMDLFTAIGRTGNPDAVPFLRETLQSRPDWADNGIAAAALLLSDKSPSPEVSALLRELLVSTAVNGYQRNLVFAALAQRGDVEAIPLYPKAYELGLQPSVRAEQKLGQQIRGAECLCNPIRLVFSTGQQQLRKLHGYDDAGITNAWRTLLASAVLPDVLADVQQSVWPESVRLLVAETVAERFDKLLARIRADNEALRHKQQQGPNASSVGPNGASLERTLNLSSIVLTLGRDTPVDASDAAVRYRAAILSLCSGEHGDNTLNSLSPAAVKVMVDQLRPLLAGANSYYAMKALRRANVPLTKDDLLTCLKSQGNRQAFVSELPPDVAPEIVRQVEAMLTDSNVELREAACAALGRFLAADSVAALLPLLRDPDQRIVAAATDALQKIRLYHEQKAFWDQFQQGVTTGREAATAKLLIQAKPGQPKDQRLLALRSLGALGAPEALPYLIEWTGDQDQELAQAARDAIGKIHQQAGVK